MLFVEQLVQIQQVTHQMRRFDVTFARVSSAHGAGVGLFLVDLFNAKAGDTSQAERVETLERRWFVQNLEADRALDHLFQLVSAF